MLRIAIAGASRGIGLEWVRQLLARGDRVEAAARKPEKSEGLTKLLAEYPQTLRVFACDVTDEASVRRWAEAIDVPLDWLINNAGVAGDEGDFAHMDFEAAREVFDVNALSGLRVSRALLPALLAGKEKKLVSITSKMGSLGDNTSGGWVSYRMSKAALNMASRCLAIELRPQGICSVVLHPGWVKTDMGGPGAPVAPQESVAGMLRVVDSLTQAQSGRFYDFRGSEVPW